MDRQRLSERGMHGDWTMFEALLFNLVTKQGDRTIPGFFSNRIRVTQAMLDAYDAEIAVLIAEDDEKVVT